MGFFEDVSGFSKLTAGDAFPQAIYESVDV